MREGPKSGKIAFVVSLLNLLYFYYIRSGRNLLYTITDFINFFCRGFVVKEVYLVGASNEIRNHDSYRKLNLREKNCAPIINGVSGLYDVFKSTTKIMMPTQ